MRANPPYALRDVAIAHADPTVRWKKRRDRTRHIFRAFPYPLPEVLVLLIEVDSIQRLTNVMPVSPKSLTDEKRT
jgi:hypothetical protein